MGVALASIALAAGAGVVGGCAKRDAGAPAPPAAVEDAGTPVDVDVMAFLSEARALHHEANVREGNDDLLGAIAALDRLVHAKRPHEGTRVPEIEEVLADTYARLAELRLRTGDVDGAAKEVEDGLAHAPDPTYFRGHLLEVEGIVEEARVAAYADAGRKAEASAARERAIKLLHEAVDVQEKVIAQSLGDKPEAADAGAPDARSTGAAGGRK